MFIQVWFYTHKNFHSISVEQRNHRKKNYHKNYLYECLYKYGFIVIRTSIQSLLNKEITEKKKLPQKLPIPMFLQVWFYTHKNIHYISVEQKNHRRKKRILT